MKSCLVKDYTWIKTDSVATSTDYILDGRNSRWRLSRLKQHKRFTNRINVLNKLFSHGAVSVLCSTVPRERTTVVQISSVLPHHSKCCHWFAGTGARVSGSSSSESNSTFSSLTHLPLWSCSHPSLWKNNNNNKKIDKMHWKSNNLLKSSENVQH